jgi:cobalamin synthase
MTLRVLRWAVIAICVVGIAGMIIGSIADNNNGVVVTFGLITAVSIIVLMAVAATARSAENRRGEVDESLAAEVEDRVQAMVAAGADEAAIRDLVGRAVRLGRSRGR